MDPCAGTRRRARRPAGSRGPRGPQGDPRARLTRTHGHARRWTPSSPRATRAPTGGSRRAPLDNGTARLAPAYDYPAGARDGGVDGGTAGPREEVEEGGRGRFSGAPTAGTGCVGWATRTRGTDSGSPGAEGKGPSLQGPARFPPRPRPLPLPLPLPLPDPRRPRRTGPESVVRPCRRPSRPRRDLYPTNRTLPRPVPFISPLNWEGRGSEPTPPLSGTGSGRGRRRSQRGQDQHRRDSQG